MRLATIEQQGEHRLAIEQDNHIVDIGKALEDYPAEGIPTDVMEVIASGEQGLKRLKAYLAALPSEGSSDAGYVLDSKDIVYGPSVTRPGKIICIGLNYRRHAEETNAPIPKYPILFNKFSNTVTGHGHDIALPNRVTQEVDYEAELVIVIGKKAKYVGKGEALDYVFGYTNVNDLSARDLQMRTPQWLLGKSCDHFSPLGPYLVTSDEVGNPNQLAIQSTVNGEIRQQSNTSDMIFSCEEIVSYISQHMTLDPGDIILTGTPEGVVLGYPEDRRVYLKHGDVVTIEIEKLGQLTNRMVDEAY
ncbi:fumarylacetoacetate hydrolase family protein [Paenibacillus sp. JCM 10914]|uniref:fumarylacetoacetate hydrolase family protein n=1 Tax=Paenibacillus sp. JCM 10914 TaxID=1236974 RepID=UPI0003CC76A9|nr:fumarylacetoacetate hydrolase family protein [Paenibacillus sp. JCM 10914]GAE08777.1 fumarylacetoacetate hydrolase family protein [Paenibacillus sp. JCM 10914]